MNNNSNIAKKSENNLPTLAINAINDLQSKGIQKKEIKDVLNEILTEVKKYNWYKLKEYGNNATDKVNYINKVIFYFFGAKKMPLCKMERGYYNYIYTNWGYLELEILEPFLNKVLSELCKLGLIRDNHKVKALLLNEFLKYTEGLVEYRKPSNEPMINLLNCTLKLKNETVELHQHNPLDFLKYTLPFEYNPDAKCPKFKRFLDEVLPEPEAQKVLFEYFGRCFIPHSALSIEKVLLLYGSGANGKSVLYNIINALFGACNISKHSFVSLTNNDTTGNNSRIELGDKILNYCSDNDFNTKTIGNTGLLKQLASGEAIQGRYLYTNIVEITEYAKLAFNCNHLPKQPHGNDYSFFRRFIIIPFEVTIPEDKQDKELANKIINDKIEMAGILNLLIKGFLRISKNKGNFTKSKLIDKALNTYQKESDSVALFIDAKGYKPSEQQILRKDLYRYYQEFCDEEGYTAVKGKSFKERLIQLGIKEGKIKGGNDNAFFCSKEIAPTETTKIPF